MPIVSLEDAQRNLASFKQDYIDLVNNPELTPKKRKDSRNSSNRKILRWQGYVQNMLDNNEQSFQYRFSGTHISSEQARKNGTLGGGRPRIFTPEENIQRAREQKRIWAKNYRMRTKMA